MAVVKIKVQGVSKIFPQPKGSFEAVKDFSLQVNEGEFLCLVGPSGCGKSTILRMLAGLITPSQGVISIQEGGSGDPLQNIVFQEYAIFPWKTVAQNVGFGLAMRGVPRTRRQAVVTEWLRKVGLLKFAEAYPHQLSGGMKQRVSIARAFANNPEILLMDEPLGALDAQIRAILQEELIRIWDEQRKTVVYITHNIEEAVFLGDRVILMTAHPGTYKTEFPIPFSRPRKAPLMSHPDFGRLTYAIWQELRVEVERTMEQQKWL